MAVLAPELTRQALWEAMRQRRVYATTGTRILLDFTLNGALMGDAVKVLDCTQQKGMRIQAHGTAPLERVDVFRSNELLRSFTTASWDFEVDCVDEEYSTGEDFYQVRILQKDGHRCWSTPIWVDLAVEGRVNFPGQEKTWRR